MPIEDSEMQQIEEFLQGGGERAADFRQRFPGLSFTPCSSGDMNGERPFRSYPDFDLYLVDGRGHCVSFTPEPTSATGIVVARHPRKRSAG